MAIGRTSRSKASKSRQVERPSQQGQTEVPLDDRLTLQRLVWSPAEPSLVIDIPPGMASQTPDILSIRQLSVQNRVYDVKPLTGDEPVQLRLRQSYLVMPLEGASRGELALVREQSQPDQVKQFVVVNDPTQHTVWIDIAETTDNFKHISIIGANRTWNIPNYKTKSSEDELKIVGIVEAILTPTLLESSSTPAISITVLPSRQRIELANGKRRTIYRDYEGAFISKAKYEALMAKPLKLREQAVPKMNVQAKQPVNRKAKQTSKKIKRKRHTKDLAVTGATALAQYEQPVLSLAEHSIVPPSISSEAILFTERTPLTLNGPGSTRLSSIGIHGHEYEVMAVDPTAASSAFVDLLPGQQYSLIPIVDEAKTSDTLRRYILVKEHMPISGDAALDKSARPISVVLAVLRPIVARGLQIFENSANPLAGHVEMQAIDINRLRTEISLPPLLKPDEFLDTTTKAFADIDFLYSVLALMHWGNAETLDHFASFLQSKESTVAITSNQVYSFAIPGTIEPLRLVSVHYGSPLSFIVEGLLPIVKPILDLFAILSQRKKLAFETSQSEIDNYMKRIATLDHLELPEAQKDAIRKTLSEWVASLLERPLPYSDVSKSAAGKQPKNYNNANLRGEQMSGASLIGASFLRAEMTGINLSKADLANANMQHANLLLADLQEAHMVETSLIGANLCSANLQRANLSGATIAGASLERANLFRANLRDANLAKANLQNANLLFADLSGVDFTGANLHDAKVSDEQLSLARSLSSATMPNGSIHS
jgi:uncharacterized protein YjbI with pentapeptide repeats